MATTALAYLCPTEVSQLIRLAFFRNNRPLEPQAAQYMTADFQNILKTKYSKLTIQELEYVFNKGIFGEYGTNYGLSEVTFINWINEYLDSDERRSASLELAQRNLKALPQPKITEKEQIQLDVTYMCRKWNEFKKHKYNISEYGILYPMFVKYGLHNYDKAELIEIEKRLQAEKEREQSKISKIHPTWGISKIFESKFQTHIKEIYKIAALSCFEKLLKENRDFVEILQNHLKTKNIKIAVE